MDNSFYRIKSISDKWYKTFHKIYSVSFPVHEQRNEQQQISAFGKENYYLIIKTEGEKLLSFIAYWDFDDYVYIEHLAVNPQYRGANIGSNTLNSFAEIIGKTILLEIDPIIDDVSRKRLHFYEKLGYVLNPYEHSHPAYDINFKPHRLLVLSHGKGIDETQYLRFHKNLSEVVMNDRN